MRLESGVIESIDTNVVDISSAWLTSTSDVYSDETYTDILSQPISVEANTLNELRFKATSTTLTIRDSADPLSAVLWSGEVVLLQDPVVALPTAVTIKSVGVADPIPPVFTDLGSGSFAIAACNVNLYSTTNYVGTIDTYAVAASGFTLTSGTEQYLCIHYNAGAPGYYLESVNSNINGSDVIAVYVMWLATTGTAGALEIHSVSLDSRGIGLPNKVADMMTRTRPYELTYGQALTLNETSAPVFRTVLIAGAIVYAGVDPINVLALNSSTAGQRLTRVNHVAGVWTYTNTTQYNNNDYDNGTNLVSMGANRYGVRWFYRSIGDDIQAFYVCTGNYSNVGDAKAESVPTGLPPILQDHCVLVGRMIIQQGANIAIAVENVATITFQSSTATTHNALNGLQGNGPDYYHLDSAQYTPLSTWLPTGPWLPLTAGSSYPITGNLYLNPSVTQWLLHPSGGHYNVSVFANGTKGTSGILKVQGADGTYLQALGLICDTVASQSPNYHWTTDGGIDTTAYLPLTGGTLTGNLTISTASGGSYLTLNSSILADTGVAFYSPGVTWILGTRPGGSPTIPAGAIALWSPASGGTAYWYQSTSLFQHQTNVNISGNLTVTGATTLATSLNGFVRAASGVISASTLTGTEVNTALGYTAANASYSSATTVTVTGDGIYTIASGARLDGTYNIRWEGSNRVEQLTVLVKTTQYDGASNASLTILGYSSYTFANSISAVTIYASADNVTRYLTITLGNRNSSTGSILAQYTGAYGASFGGTYSGSALTSLTPASETMSLNGSAYLRTGLTSGGWVVMPEGTFRTNLGSSSYGSLFGADVTASTTNYSLTWKRDAGDTALNSTGTTRMCVNNVDAVRANSTRVEISNTPLSTMQGTATTAYVNAGQGTNIGAAIYPWGSAATNACFSHANFIGVPLSYCLIQTSSGATYINAASGQTTNFQINNGSNLLTISASSVTASLPIISGVSMISTWVSSTSFSWHGHSSWNYGGNGNSGFLQLGTTGDVLMCAPSGSGGAALQYNSTTRLLVTNTGVAVTGTLTATSSIKSTLVSTATGGVICGLAAIDTAIGGATDGAWFGVTGGNVSGAVSGMMVGTTSPYTTVGNTNGVYLQASGVNILYCSANYVKLSKPEIKDGTHLTATLTTLGASVLAISATGTPVYSLETGTSTQYRNYRLPAAAGNAGLVLTLITLGGSGPVNGPTVYTQTGESVLKKDGSASLCTSTSPVTMWGALTVRSNGTIWNEL